MFVCARPFRRARRSAWLASKETGLAPARAAAPVGRRLVRAPAGAARAALCLVGRPPGSCVWGGPHPDSHGPARRASPFLHASGGSGRRMALVSPGARRRLSALGRPRPGAREGPNLASARLKAPAPARAKALTPAPARANALTPPRRS